jgi:ABC-2 type transport system permease protein
MGVSKMRNSFKVAKWEIKRNMKNKSFIISLFLTPLIFLAFATLPTLLSGIGNSDPEPMKVYIYDELNIWEEVEPFLIEQLDWVIYHQVDDEEMIMKELEKSENTAYIPITERALVKGNVDVYMSKDVDDFFIHEVRILEPALRGLQLELLGLSEAEIEIVARGVEFQAVTITEKLEELNPSSDEENLVDPMERGIPGAFAGLILFSVVITGVMIFQSASQEKKEKVAEMVLSSLTPTELMQGKIIGYFALGIIQVSVWLAFAIPIITWKFNLPILKHLLVPELIVLLLIALAGYLLFAALFVGIGATVEDMTTSGNFQGIVIMLPWLPFLFIGPVLNDPSSLVAQIGSYIPFTAPGVMILRLALLEEWPWIEILISLTILLISVWLFMKLAGKIFKTGILMYGKNATPQEIWKWLRH